MTNVRAGTQEFAAAVSEGLSRPMGRRRLPCEYFFDDIGAALFSQICELAEYYPTRTEMSILQDRLGTIVEPYSRTGILLVELGPGDGRKSRLWLAELCRRGVPTRYVGIDLALGPVTDLMERLRSEFPRIDFTAIPKEYIRGLQALPSHGETPVVVLWLGTSIGNLEPPASLAVLTACRQAIGKAGRIVVGIDLKKDTATLEKAYNDSLGVTAGFNMNILGRINREFGGNFDLNWFSHRAFYNERDSRIEMHLVSRRAQEVRISGLHLTVAFEVGEAIHTENSYKFARADIEEIARKSGCDLREHYVDAKSLFSVNILGAL